MGFNNEEYLEEILIKAHDKGYASELLSEVDKLKGGDMKMTNIEYYFKALKNLNVGHLNG